MEFKYSDDNKRYHTLSYYNKHKFGRKILKAVIDAGFTCPNKDGVKGNGGVFSAGTEADILPELRKFPFPSSLILK